jgi:heptosyltransferase I
MTGAAGDAVHVLPVVTAIKRHHPASRVTWILQPGPASLISGHADVDEILRFRRSAGLKGFVELGAELRKREFDIALVMQTSFKAGVIAAMTRARVKLGFDRGRSREMTWVFNTASLPPRGQRHYQDQFLEFAEAIGVTVEPLEWKLGPWPSEMAWRDEFRARFDRPIATLVLGTSRRDKSWFDDRWAAVARALYSDYGLAPVLAGGRSAAERAGEQVVLSRAGVPVTSTLGESFRRLVSILDASELVITANTGPLHMAVALGVPTISLNAFNDPRRVGPYRRFLDLSIDEFADPGEVLPVTWETRPGRMQRITTEAVLAKVRLWDERYRNRPKS